MDKVSHTLWNMLWGHRTVQVTTIPTIHHRNDHILLLGSPSSTRSRRGSHRSTPPIWCLNTSSMAIFCSCALWSMMLATVKPTIKAHSNHYPPSTTREVQMRHTRSLDFYVVIASDFNENTIWPVMQSNIHNIITW